jgi:DNA topoisomerase-1
VGKHPESGEPILANIGRFGPYVQHGKTFANLTPGDDVLTIGLNRAVDLIATKENQVASGRARRRSGRQARWAIIPMAAPVTVRPGKYGPYVNWGKVNATLPKSMNPDAVTFEQALDLIRAKQASRRRRQPRRPRPARLPPRSRQADESDTADKKPAAKKAAPSQGKEAGAVGTRKAVMPRPDAGRYHGPF